MSGWFSRIGRTTLSLAAAFCLAGVVQAQQAGSNGGQTPGAGSGVGTQYPGNAGYPGNSAGGAARSQTSPMSPNMLPNATGGRSSAGGSLGLGSGSNGRAGRNGGRGVGGGAGGAGLGGTLANPDSRVHTESGLAPGRRNGPDNKAHIRLRVPEDATVWVDGVKTKQTGEARYFFSPPLTPGKQYSYTVRIRWEKDGNPVELTRRVPIHAGATVRLDLTRPESDRDDAAARERARK